MVGILWWPGPAGWALVAMALIFGGLVFRSLAKDVFYLKIFRQSFGVLPPRTKYDWKEHRVMGPAVLAILREMVSKFEAVCSLEEKAMDWASPKLLKDQLDRLKSVRYLVEWYGRRFRRAQNAAQHFGFKVPDDLERIKTCDKI